MTADNRTSWGALPPWNSDEYDRAIKAQRQLERAARPKSQAHNIRGNSNTTVTYDGTSRGLATDEDLRRRRAVERAMQRRATKKKGGQ